MTTDFDAAAIRAARRTNWFKWLNRVVLAVIVINFCVAAWLEFDHEEVLEAVDVGIIWFFVAEVTVKMITKIRTAGLRGLWSFWLIADAVIIFLAVLPLGANATALRVMRLARFAHLTRHLPHLTAHLRHLPILRIITAGRK